MLSTGAFSPFFSLTTLQDVRKQELLSGGFPGQQHFIYQSINRQPKQLSGTVPPKARE